MIKFIDISHHQNPKSLNWDFIKKEYKYLVVRTQYGIKKDRLFIEHIKNARSHGLKIGAYMFWRSGYNSSSDVNNTEQLKVFKEQISAIEGLNDGDFLPVLDLENDMTAKGEVLPENWSEYIKKSAEMAELLKKEFGGVIIYTYPYFLTDRLKSPDFAKQNPLWIAHYGVKTPSMPRGWEDMWSAWQFTTKPNPATFGKAEIDQNLLKLTHEDRMLMQKKDDGGVTRDIEKALENLIDISDDFNEIKVKTLFQKLEDAIEKLENALETLR